MPKPPQLDPFRNFPWPQEPEEDPSSFLYAPLFEPQDLLCLVLAGVERAPTPSPRSSRPTVKQWHALLILLFTLLTDEEARKLFKWTRQWMTDETYAQMFENARQKGFFITDTHCASKVMVLAIAYRKMPNHGKATMFSKGISMLDTSRRYTMRSGKDEIMGTCT